MSEITINVEELDAQINRLVTLKEKISSSKIKCPTVVGGGTSVQAIEDMGLQYRKMQKQLEGLVSNTVEFMKNVNDTFRQRDINLADKILTAAKDAIVVGNNIYNAPSNYNNYVMNQWNYGKFNDSVYGNSGCGAVSLAMALSIINDKAYNPETDIGWIDGVGVVWSPFHSYNNIDNNTRLKILYEELQQGNPSVIRVGSKYHYVTVVGLDEDADVNNLKWEDFLIADPGYGDICRADRYTLNPYGGQIVTANYH